MHHCVHMWRVFTNLVTHAWGIIINIACNTDIAYLRSMCVFVQECVCVCICVSMYVFVHVHMCMYTHMDMCVCIHVWERVSSSVCICAWIYKCNQFLSYPFFLASTKRLKDSYMYVHTSCTTAFISTLSVISEDTTWISPSTVAFIILSHSSCSRDTSVNIELIVCI